jgi:hypothetical protein
MKTAAGEAARRSHVRSQISAEISYALLERYDPACGDALIERLLADSEPAE